jgi:RHS repeat-associated protein
VGRTTSVLYPDGNAATSSYRGLSTTVKDAGGKTRTLGSDELGHLTSVTEDPGGLGYVTTYPSYTALNDLLAVSQSGQTRGFWYDSFSRLTQATNPESGTLTYTYDGDGNVLTKQDARGTTTYAYDELNRLLSKNYSDTSTVRACYAYDGFSPPWGDTGPNAVGHLTSSWSVQHGGTVVAADESYQFDPMGRAWAGKQCTPATCGLTNYPLAMAYNLMGNETGLADSSVTRSTSYDSTDRLLSFAATLPSMGNQNLLTNPQYSALGLTQVSLGNGLTESRGYNLQRTWLNSVQVGSLYSFSIPTFDGNGNVLTANDNTNGNWTYQYDSVNRLKTATIGGQNFNYFYTADGSSGQFGNMTCTAPSGTTYSCTPLGLSFNQSNNQINSSGYSYDGAGNLLTDNTHGYVYDLENRLTCVLGTDGTCTSATATLYLYDAAGQRVGKQQADTLEDYVYDPQGQITSVYQNGSTSPFRAEIYTPGGRHVATWNPGATGGPLFFNHTDWLGTERVRTNSSGGFVQSFTDTPYGMNLAYSPSADTSPMHFTGKQRDSESNLDYFGARYFGGGNNLGRFMTPDPTGKAAAHVEDPQTWSMYSYVRNNPMSMVDPKGTDALWVTDQTTGQTTLVIPVHFTGAGATKEEIANIVNRDNALNTGDSKVNIQVIPTDKPINGVLNQMDLSPGNDTKMCGAAGECTNRVGGNKAHVNSEHDGGASDAGPHETLHYAGMKDQYTVTTDAQGTRTGTPTPGYDTSNIMTSRSGTNLKPEQIQEASTNSTTKQCTTQNGNTVCK